MSVTWVAGTSLQLGVEVDNFPSTNWIQAVSTTPAGIANGDTLIAAVFQRQALTAPAGWTLLLETAAVSNGTSISQRLAVYSKNTVTSADSSTAFTWRSDAVDSNTRLGVAYAVLRGVSSLAASSSATGTSVNSWQPAPPALTAANSGEIFLLYGSTVNTSGSSAPTGPAGATVFTGAGTSDQRLAGAYQGRDNGQANSGSFNMSPGSGSTTNGIAAVTLRFAPAADPGVTGYVAAAGPLGAALLRGIFGRGGPLLCPGPLGAPRLRAFHDFSSQMADIPPRYVMDLSTPAGTVRAPISSWQATLRTSGPCYVQCVIPACEPYLDAINAATAFTIYITGSLPGVEISYVMASAAPNFVQLAQGPSRYTANMSGYSDAFADDAGLPSSLDRALLAVRSVFVEPSGLRIRCAVDWLLRPGMRAVHGAVTFDVGTISYYCADGDQYMDVKEAAAG